MKNIYDADLFTVFVSGVKNPAAGDSVSMRAALKVPFQVTSRRLTPQKVKCMYLFISQISGQSCTLDLN